MNAKKKVAAAILCIPPIGALSVVVWTGGWTALFVVAGVFLIGLVWAWAIREFMK